VYALQAMSTKLGFYRITLLTSVHESSQRYMIIHTLSSPLLLITFYTMCGLRFTYSGVPQCG
jgi:hypothetical protein